MKQFIILLTLFTLIGCKQTASDAKKAILDDGEAREERSKAMGIISNLTFVAGGAVVPNPIKTAYTFRNSNPEGDSHQVFFDYKEYDNDKTYYEGSLAISFEKNDKAYKLLEQVRAIENGKTFKPKGEGCVGNAGRSYSMKYFDGREAKFDVEGGAMCESDKLPAVIRDLNALGDALANDLKAQKAMSIYQKIVGKKWQSKSDPSKSFEIINGNMTEMVKGVAKPPYFASFSDNCPGNKDRSEGMSAGNIGCLTTWAQDEVHYMITDLDETTLELSQTGTDKIEAYKLAKSNPTSPADGIVINAKGDDFFFGKKFDINNLPALLDEKLAKMDKIPDDIPVTFNGEALMGIRGEVRTEIKEAIAKAKANKAKH